jgi:glycosyltransferase involved in cell wall biosynthesis
MGDIQFSIITPSFNSEKTIAKTIESILRQAYVGEYIVIDGGSTDNTINIINSYRGEFLIKNINLILISESDTGIYNAMNKGINISQYPWIGILNSDDYYFQDALKSVAEKVIKERPALIHGDILVSDGVSTFYARPNTNYDEICRAMCIFHPATFVSKTLYDALGLYNERYKLSSDYDFIYRVLSSNWRNKIYYVDSPLAVYFDGGASKVSRKAGLLENYTIRRSFGVGRLFAMVYYFREAFLAPIKLKITRKLYG